MRDLAVVTGGGTGLGQALAKKLVDKGVDVVIVGRREEKLTETQQHHPSHIQIITADVSTPEDRVKIVETLQQRPIRFLIHNAAIVTPILPLEKISLSDWRQIQAINVEGPLFLTQALLSHLPAGARILHISSDCAHYPMGSWIPYCVSKAALFMAYQCLKKELADKNIFIGSVDPGMMYTPMQEYICSDNVTFDEKMPLKQLVQEKIIFTPEHSAEFCLHMLFDLSPAHFSQQEYVVSG